MTSAASLFSKRFPQGSMDRYGMSGKILAKEGQRDALIGIRPEASRTPMKVARSTSLAGRPWSRMPFV